MKKSFNFIVAIVLLTLFLNVAAAFANNLQISNVSLTGQDQDNDYVMVECDISWDNSWRTDDLNGDGVTNWDAAWIFIKYKASDGNYYHSTLNTTDGNHDAGSQGTDATIDAGSDGMGVFFYRSENGTGTFSSTNVQLRWEYGTDGLSDDLDNDAATVEVFAIEMVYVPQGSFYLGSGGSESRHFYKYPTTTDEFQVTSEGAINTGTTNDYLWAESGDFIESGTIPAGFPKGYDAFYCMKYEMTQEQYVDFLNTLTYDQQEIRVAVAPSSGAGTHAFTEETRYRNGIEVMTSGTENTVPAVFGCDFNNNGTYNESGDGQNIACNFLSWADGAAYSDWSGLRPMTELEYEKACRGGATPVANEYAWGTTNIAGSAYTLSNNAGAGNEEIATNYSTTAGNFSYSSIDGSINGPLRVGIFASNTNNSGRETSGASYYGVMELSGNLWERPVTIGNSTGRAFTGAHGNGELGSTGNADASNWPGINAVGSGSRGGGWNSLDYYCRPSDRNGASGGGSSRGDYDGFRCAHSGE